MKRRRFLQIGLGGLGALAPEIARAQAKPEDLRSPAPAAPGADLLQYLCPPNTYPDPLATPSPYAEPHVAELFVPPVKRPLTGALNPAPVPEAHQLYERYEPQRFYEIREQEFKWQYHPHPPYASGTWGWGFDGMTPGPTFHARYGEPVMVRMINELPPVGISKATFALPSTSTHLHNGHTASESDGNPQDWIDPGEFWDHHYAMFPSGGDEAEKLTTLWYHDHRLDFTAANVYAGLSGFFLYFDELDTGNELDPKPAYGLPSGDYDVPLMIHDVLFDESGQVRFNNFFTDGWLGDQVTANRRIRPRFTVEARKYRFRIVNGGPSRFYQFFLGSEEKPDIDDDANTFCVVTGDGNFLPRPLWTKRLFMSVAQRYDVIIDFSKYEVGDRVYLYNDLEQTNGKGPSGRVLDEPYSVLRFDVVEAKEPDRSRIPSRLRDLPSIPPQEELRKLKHRVWEFDYDGGLWTINGRVMDPNRIDAGIAQNSAEIWTFRNTGNDWSHPVHCHFTEFLILEVNGRPFPYDAYQGVNEATGELVFSADDGRSRSTATEVFYGGPRRDVATILPNDEMKVLIRFHDFLGRHVMHCHNVVHEDHAMMIRWDMLPPEITADGCAKPRSFDGPKRAEDVWDRHSLWGVASSGPEGEHGYPDHPLSNFNGGVYQQEDIFRGADWETPNWDPGAPPPDCDEETE